MVHPDFKIIVHMPQSKLATTPLPFLNRFEKYFLSIDDALKERIQKGAWLKVHVATEYGRSREKNVFDVLDEGCEDMVQKLHFTNQNGQLFYGLVPRETVSSYLLSVVERSTMLESHVPEILPAFKLHKPTVEIKEDQKEEKKEEENMEKEDNKKKQKNEDFVNEEEEESTNEDQEHLDAAPITRITECIKNAMTTLK